MRVRILGVVEVGRGETWQRLSAAKLRSLLAILVIHAGRPASVETLTAELWPDGPPPSAANQIHVYVLRLRRALYDPDGRLLRTRSSGYELVLSNEDLDASRFEELVKRGNSESSGDAHLAAELFDDALSLWRGPAFADVSATAAVKAAADRLEEHRLSVLETRNNTELSLGRYAQLIPELQALTEAHPFRERFWEHLVLALYHSGRQADALYAYRRCYSLLREEIGVEPCVELQGLHQQILRGDLHLRVAGRKQPRARRSAPARRRVVPRQLPPLGQPFVGREDEIKLLDELAAAGSATGASRIGLIMGPPGIGKTATAVHWAHRAAELFPDGQLYVDLRGFDPSGTPMTTCEAGRLLLDALGMSPEQIPDQLEARVGLHRSLLAGRRMLIVLDNAHDVEQVRPLLPGDPSCFAIVTSRRQLTGLVAELGASPLTLEPLGDTEATQLLGHRLGVDRISAEPTAVVALVQRCSRLPLALAIAAARAAVNPQLPLSCLAADLADAQDRLDVLDTGDAATTVRAVFSWSYRGQSAAAQRVFRLIGLHPGPHISLHAAACLAGAPLPAVRQLLDELVQAHLIEEQIPGQFTFLELLRAYAIELAKCDEPEAELRAAIGRLLEPTARSLDRRF